MQYITYYGSENFNVSLSITFLNPKILGLHFCTKNCLTWGGEKKKNLISENRREFIR